MMKYSEIKLDNNQKTLLKIFKASGYKSIGNDDMNGLVMSDGSRAVSLYGLKDFDWIETNSYYEIDKLLNPPQDKTVWDLKKGDVFWWISSSGFIYKDRWDNSSFDIGCRNQGNIFLTEEEAQLEVRRREREVFATAQRRYADIKVAEYCDNDILATKEAKFESKRREVYTKVKSMQDHSY